VARHDRVPFPALAGSAGLAILGNSRLALLPPPVDGYVAFSIRPRRRALATAALLVAAATLVVSPWALRNKAEIGCFAITTDARALWKANNSNTYGRAGAREVDRRRSSSSERPTVARTGLEDSAQDRLRVPVDECTAPSLPHRRTSCSRCSSPSRWSRYGTTSVHARPRFAALISAQVGRRRAASMRPVRQGLQAALAYTDRPRWARGYSGAVPPRPPGST